jgi:hypothetical protein
MVATPFQIEKLFSGSLAKLRTEASYFSTLTDHNPELGRLNESHLVSLLRNYLPSKYGIGTGFLVSGGAEPKQSPQCDIIVYDTINNAPFYSSGAWSIFPIEMVYAVIEVKTTLNRMSLEDTFVKCGYIRGMAKTSSGDPNKCYSVQDKPKQGKPVRYLTRMSSLPPRFFLFGYNGWQSINGLRKNFAKVSDSHPDAHIHGVCNLTISRSLFVQHVAFAKRHERYAALQAEGFHQFLMAMPYHLNSMLPPDRNNLFFDMVNVEHYYSHRRSGNARQEGREPEGQR